MKKVINKKLLLILITSQLIFSCTITRAIWGRSSTFKYEETEKFFINKEKSKIVLIGEAGYKTEVGTYHYSISDKSEGSLIRIFELAQKSGDVDFEMHGVETTGEKVTGGFWIGFNKKNLLKEDLKIARKEGLRDNNNKTFLGRPCRFDNAKTRLDHSRWPLAQTIRYPSSKEPVKNFCSKINQSSNCIKIIKLKKPWQGSIKDNYTTSDKAIRVAATPLAIALDIILSPLYIIGVLAMGAGSN